MKISKLRKFLNQIKNRSAVRPVRLIYFTQAKNFLTPHPQHLCTGSATDKTNGADDQTIFNNLIWVR